MTKLQKDLTDASSDWTFEHHADFTAVYYFGQLTGLVFAGSQEVRERMRPEALRDLGTWAGSGV